MHPEPSSSQSELNFCPGKQPVVLQETGGSAAFAKTYFEPETRRDSVIEWQRGWATEGQRQRRTCVILREAWIARVGRAGRVVLRLCPGTQHEQRRTAHPGYPVLLSLAPSLSLLPPPSPLPSPSSYPAAADVATPRLTYRTDTENEWQPVTQRDWG